MALTPMRITLYDPATSEVKGEYNQLFVPWRLLKVAVRLAKELGGAADLSDEQVDALAGLVVETFGNRFSVQDLESGADISEMMTVLQTIVGRASGSMKGNPTLPG